MDIEPYVDFPLTRSVPISVPVADFSFHPIPGSPTAPLPGGQGRRPDRIAAHLRTLVAFLLVCLAGLGAEPAQAQVVVDKTCATCGRRQLDSLNLHPRNIRVNQVGYLPQDDRKHAFVANAAASEFQVIDAATKTSVFKGALSPIGPSTEGGIRITGYYNSINPLYTFEKPAASVTLSLADFSGLKAPGRYFLVCGKDTSGTFAIDDQVYNIVFGKTLNFFGAQRCGPTHSWFHKDCHLKDGSALGAGRAGELAGGWHDCGDHGKYGETEGYAALAFFSWGWEPFNPAYAAECLAAAKDIYAKIISVKRGSNTTNPCCYPGGGPTRDDEALAAFALWFATKDTTYKFDLLDNPALGRSPNAQFNQGEFSPA